MYSQKINSVATRLAALAGSVTEEQWSVIRAARAELADAAEGVLNMEKELCIPDRKMVEEVGA